MVNSIHVHQFTVHALVWKQPCNVIVSVLYQHFYTSSNTDMVFYE